MKALLNWGRSLWREGVILALLTFLNLPMLLAFPGQPAYAADTGSTLSSQESIERAYEEFGEATGIREEVYQQRLSEGQNPEKMPKPYKRVESFADRKEVPATSLVETAVSKTRSVVEKATGQAD